MGSSETFFSSVFSEAAFVSFEEFISGFRLHFDGVFIISLTSVLAFRKDRLSLYHLCTPLSQFVHAFSTDIKIL